MAYGANNRIYMQETGKPNVSIATLIDSRYLPRQSRTIKITESGIERRMFRKAQFLPFFRKKANFNIILLSRVR
ncbi:MAG: hypothetical protein QXK93_06990 [Candidatus Bathyarchaeia archaeon]